MNESREQQLQSILHGYLQTIDRGEKPDRQAILDAHPDLRDELAAYFADASKLEAMAKSLKTASFSPANRAQPAFKAPTPAELADKFPHFELVELLGQGGMGAVYKAKQKGLDRFVALKILPPDAGRDASFAERFLREARALAKLSHPNIVGVHDVGQTADGLCYFVMEFIDGVNLRQAMGAGSMTPKEALAIVPQICDALQFAHDEGIVHRDIKPENVLLDKKGRVKIADFGLAKLLGSSDLDASLTGTHQVMGTLRYMAPEQMEGSKTIDHRADIYSLGVVFYELLTGELPMGRFAPPSKKVQIDVRLDEVVLRALEKEPEQRWQHANEVKTEIQEIEHSATTKREAATPSPRGRVSKHGRKILIALALGLLAIGILTWQIALRIERPLEKWPAVTLQAYVPSALEEKEARKQQLEWAEKLRIRVETKSPTGIAMVLIPPAGETLPKPYMLGKYEVTQEEWQAVMGYNPSFFQNPGIFQKGRDAVRGMDTSRFPVEQVSWFECVEYCNKLSEKEGLEPYYELTAPKRSDQRVLEAEVKILGGNGYHIPTAAEWEHGGRAGTKTKFHFGDESEDLPEHAWIMQRRPQNVGELKPNAFGLFDTHGNVAEWNEEIGKNASGAPQAVHRGDYWGSGSAFPTSLPGGVDPTACRSSTGLRLARGLSGDVPAPPVYLPATPEEKEAKKLQSDWAVKLKMQAETMSPIGIAMVLIPPAGEALPKPYLLGKYEVTQWQWEAVMGNNPSNFKTGSREVGGLDTIWFPVDNVSWFDSVEYCNKLSEKEGLKPYYELTVSKRSGPAIRKAVVKIIGGNGYHIPTDAEWEHGCRAGSKAYYHFGSKDEDLGDFAWYEKNSDKRMHGVGEKKPNAFGLFDMHGNVGEWNEEMLTNATGAPERVIRGGDWVNSAGNCAASFRIRLLPTDGGNACGLRLARVP